MTAISLRGINLPDLVAATSTRFYVRVSNLILQIEHLAL
jgi:hypothetical protein